MSQKDLDSAKQTLQSALSSVSDAAQSVTDQLDAGLGAVSSSARQGSAYIVNQGGEILNRLEVRTLVMLLRCLLQQSSHLTSVWASREASAIARTLDWLLCARAHCEFLLRQRSSQDTAFPSHAIMSCATPLLSA